MYENKYREYLDDKDFYQKHLKNKGAPQYSDQYGGYGGLMAVAAILGGGYAAFERGLLKGVLHDVIQGLSRFQPGKIDAVTDAFNRMATHQVWETKGSTIRKYADVIGMSPKIFREAFNDYEMRSKANETAKSLSEHPIELMQAIEDRIKVRKRSRYWQRDGILNKDVNRNEMDMIMIRKIHQHFDLNEVQEAKHIQQTGHRHATVGDVWGHISAEHKAQLYDIQRRLRQSGEDVDVMKWKADQNILINGKNHIADLRPVRHTAGRFMDSFANEFGIPLVHFNPVKLFYLDNLLTNHRAPFFALLHPNSRNPLVTGHNGFVGRPLLYANGDVHDMGTPAMNKIADNMYAVSAKEGTVPRLMRHMAGIPLKTWERPKQGFWNKLRYDTADILDLGFQDEPIRRFRDDMGDTVNVDFAAGHSDMLSAASNWFSKRMPIVPKESEITHMKRLDEAYGGKEAEWFLMRSYKPLQESNSFKDYLKQFYASRSRLNEVTTGTLFGYGFFERLNAALNSMGMGLSVRSMGSGFDVVKNLTTKRFVPIALAGGALAYGDYVSEMIMDEPMSHKIAKFYKQSSVEMAAARDALGITDWAKSWAGVFIGGEQISELPLVGKLFDINDSEEETREYWESGSDPIRKGRYWDLGNTPFTGGQTEYFRPNWVRRTLADVKYSDSMYGSREEYWDHYWLPTPTSPLAPIRHFLTDPYWFEKKHYDDRPYPITGGIDEFEAIPLIGTTISSTLGAILKPQKDTHQDWREEQKQEESLSYGRHTVDSIIPTVIDPAMNASMYAAVNNAAEAVHASYSPSGDSETEIVVRPLGADIPANLSIGTLPEIPEGQQIAYTTASGDTQVMRLNPGVSVEELNWAIREKGIKRSGKTTTERLQKADPDVADMFSDKSDPMDPGGLETMIGNLHYNVAEMGGFYGFVSNTITGESFDDRPVLQASSRATSYERAFWDQDLGGLGGEANEIFRRFLPHRRRQIEEINPIRNTMPSWMPGSDYYIDFQHGDPYIKVKNGEERLPGEGYEKLWGIKGMGDMSIGASFIGKDQESIIRHLLKRDELDFEDSEDVLTYGEDLHKRMQKDLTAKGIMVDYEQYIRDEKHAIGGFYDGRVKNEEFLQWVNENAVMVENRGGNTPSEAILEIKTMGDKAFSSGEIKQEHLVQLNFYMGQTGLGRGYLAYYNRDEPEATPQIHGYDFDPDLYQESIRNVEEARNRVRELMSNGVIGPADFYDYTDRLRILADVAPYSDEYRSLRDQIGKINLSEEDKKKVQEIREQVADKKKKTRIYDYKFRTANVKEERVTVTKVLDNNTFLTAERPDNPIKLAGIRVPMGKDDPIAQQAEALIARYIKSGDTINILVDADPLKEVSDDTYRTIGAVVEAGGIKNLNQELLKKGLAKERENDDSAPGIYARYTPLQRQIGSFWERIAHLDTIFNTKWLQVRSPLESYERREVYGKDWQTWTDPVDSFIVPLVNQTIHAGPVWGSVAFGFIGWLTGRTRFAKLVGGSLGALTGIVLGGFGELHDYVTGETWIPAERKKEWDMNEYLDMLRFVKDRMLFARYSEEALKEENFDVRDFLRKNKEDGEGRKKQVRYLEKLKRELHSARSKQERAKILHDIREAIGYKEQNGKEDKDLLRALNQRIEYLGTIRRVEELGPKAAKALQYYKDSQQTIYGYEPGGPLQDLLAALPKKDREYLLPLMNAPLDEREDILGTVPVYLRRPLEASWGLPVEPKEDVETYFTKHQLPDPGWIGWDERVSLDDVKVKMVKREAMDASEFDIWADGVKRADDQYIPTPKLYDQSTVANIQTKLKHMFEKNGFSDLQVDVTRTGSGKIEVDMNISKDRRREIMNRLNEEGQNIFA